MTRIVAATRHECCGIGTITLDTDKGIISKFVDGNEVKIKANDIAVQHVEDGRTRVICDHISSGKDNPHAKNHCMKIKDATSIACLTVLNVRPSQDNESNIAKKTHLCRWFVPPIDKDENL